MILVGTREYFVPYPFPAPCRNFANVVGGGDKLATWWLKYLMIQVRSGFDRARGCDRRNYNSVWRKAVKFDQNRRMY